MYSEKNSGLEVKIWNVQMSKFKCQSSKEIQSPNEMPRSKILDQVQDLVRHDKPVILNLVLKQVQGLRFQNLVSEF